MYDYESQHVGKDLFRSKEHEEDILVKSLVGSKKGVNVPISLKASGDGPLQLSTDEDEVLYHYLQNFGTEITSSGLKNVLSSDELLHMRALNVMPLIYNEEKQRCNIMVFDFQKAYRNVSKILFVNKDEKFDKNSDSIIKNKGRKHPIYMFLDSCGNYICEVRYGGKSANALQRGLWTHTKNATNYFDSLTGGWIDYSINNVLVHLFSLALNSTITSHKAANIILQEDINRLKQTNDVG